jgi:hypothetical protein
LYTEQKLNSIIYDVDSSKLLNFRSVSQSINKPHLLRFGKIQILCDFRGKKFAKNLWLFSGKCLTLKWQKNQIIRLKILRF